MGMHMAPVKNRRVFFWATKAETYNESGSAVAARKNSACAYTFLCHMGIRKKKGMEIC